MAKGENLRKITVDLELEYYDWIQSEIKNYGFGSLKQAINRCFEIGMIEIKKERKQKEENKDE